MIPGSNLLEAALSVIASQTVTYYRYLGRTQNDVKQFVSEYADPVNLTGSFQPVPKRLYEQYGLDFQKEYFTFYASANILDVNRTVANDKISFNGSSFNCESSNDWFAIDGWKGVLCVKEGQSA